MRITYRSKDNYQYWRDRWLEIESDDAMINDNYYPLKYSNMVVNNKNEKILEAGCGAGRILRHYHDKNFKITGIDFIKEAIDKLKKVDTSLDVKHGTILNLEFENNYFDIVLAFGLYHNFQSEDLDKSLSETYRVLKHGGKLCASFRSDNIQELIVDIIRGEANSEEKKFHKLNLKKNEFKNLIEKSGFKINKIFSVQNMPFLYKFSFFRSPDHRKFNENKGRIEGYKLSFFGNFIQKCLMRFFPDSFCNIYLILAEKK